MTLNHHRVGSGEPLLLIHGIGSRWQIWEPVLDRLAAQHDVIAIDLPGFGESPMPTAGTTPGPASLATLVSAFLDEIGVSQPHVAGNSLGGLLALELARRGRARSAAGLSPAGFGNGRETQWAQRSLWLAVRLARAIKPIAPTLLKPRLARRLALAQLVAHPERLALDGVVADFNALAGAPWFDATLPTLTPDYFARELATGTGAPVPAGLPITIAWGDKDRLLLPRQAARAARLFPSATIVTLRECGHLPTLDDPEQVATVLLAASSGV